MPAMWKKLFRGFWFKHYLSPYQWYRQWYGGRWEYHFIDVCGGAMWLDMQYPDIWPKYRQPCSVGPPLIENWPVEIQV